MCFEVNEDCNIFVRMQSLLIFPNRSCSSFISVRPVQLQRSYHEASWSGISWNVSYCQSSYCMYIWHPVFLIFSCYVLTHVCRKLKCIIVVYTFKTWSTITKSVCKCRDGIKGSIKKSQTQEKGKGSEGTVSFTFPFSIFLFTLSQCHLSYPLHLPRCCSY